MLLKVAVKSLKKWQALYFQMKTNCSFSAVIRQKKNFNQFQVRKNPYHRGFQESSKFKPQTFLVVPRAIAEAVATK